MVCTGDGACIKEHPQLKFVPVLLYSSILTPDNYKKGHADLAVTDQAGTASHGRRCGSAVDGRR